ncbi:hypothetical protein ACFW1A_27010 [Kitasatospora sp. NPDC058965]|uniref:hypothetical protein n=1 Tax=Kitasatospora sp. NPDC058965 TaxID=3346682 RepID=UPI0036AEF73F
MTDQSAASLRSRYVAQAASDLEQNRHRQQALLEQIKTLRQEEALLLDILSLAERYADPADPAPPEQPADESAHHRPTHDGPTHDGRPTAVPRGAGSAGAGSRGAAPKGRPTQAVLLGDLLLELLAAHREPRSAQELRAELLRKHPDREPTAQVVRNSLESLVAKGRVQRDKAERSVRYTPLRGDQG